MGILKKLFSFFKKFKSENTDSIPKLNQDLDSLSESSLSLEELNLLKTIDNKKYLGLMNSSPLESLKLDLRNRDLLKDITDVFGRQLGYGDYIYTGSDTTVYAYPNYPILKLTPDGLLGGSELVSYTHPFSAYKINMTDEELNYFASERPFIEIQGNFKSNPDILSRDLHIGDFIVFRPNGLTSSGYATRNFKLCFRYGLFMGYSYDSSNKSYRPYAYIGEESGKKSYPLYCMGIRCCYKISSPTSDELLIKEELERSYSESVYHILKSKK